MHAGIIFLLVIIGSVLFHIFTPWYWTDIASNWQGMDDTITLTFWVGGGVFVAVCLFMVYCVFRYSYKEGRKAEYKPEDKKLEKIFTEDGNYLINHSSSVLLLKNGKYLDRISHHAAYKDMFKKIDRLLR